MQHRLGHLLQVLLFAGGGALGLGVGLDNGGLEGRPRLRDLDLDQVLHGSVHRGVVLGHNLHSEIIGKAVR